MACLFCARLTAWYCGRCTLPYCDSQCQDDDVARHMERCVPTIKMRERFGLAVTDGLFAPLCKGACAFSIFQAAHRASMDV